MISQPAGPVAPVAPVTPRQRAYPPGEAAGLWVWIEQHEGVVEDVSWELLGKGRRLADALAQPLVAVLLGRSDHLAAAAADAAALGADEVLVAAHPRLARYRTDSYTAALGQLVRGRKPSILLLGATPDGRDLAGRLAVRLYTGLTADCTDLAIGTGGVLESHVVGFGGGIAAVITCARHRPQMATVRPGVFPMPTPHDRMRRVSLVRDASVELDVGVERVHVLERHVGAGADLGRAPVVVVGGAGVRGDFHLLEELARVVGGDVGATRVAVDQGWIGRERQIGQTGVVVRPKVAIACGVSGASQFAVGIAAAGTVIAINSDPDAPVFEAADYGVVDDLFRVLPPLVADLRTRLPGETERV